MLSAPVGLILVIGQGFSRCAVPLLARRVGGKRGIWELFKSPITPFIQSMKYDGVEGTNQ